MEIREHESLKAKNTMRIGGTARFYAEVRSREDVEQAWRFAAEKGVPLIVLGGGSNTVFADAGINALVVRIKADTSVIDGSRITVQAGKILAMLINELAGKDLDLSALTGIPGSVGGAVFGNAGQGPDGVWLDAFIENVTIYDGQWRTLAKEDCHFRYRESAFKEMNPAPVIWEAVLNVPSRPGAEVKADVERLLKKRIETQPHLKTAGSCFKALPDGTPAWKLIEAAGLRGLQVGGVQVSGKHANFLLNVSEGSFEDLRAITRRIREAVPAIAGIEMRLYGSDGQIAG